MIDATIERLIAGGFKISGRWKLDSASRPWFIGDVPDNPGVYAYAVGGIICYVGSAQRGLHNRMCRYKRIETGPVATRIRGLIAEALKAGSEVVMLTIVPRAMRRKGLPIDMIAGLEEGLIREMQPKWNKRGLGAIRKKSASN